jgi:putative membrane protein
MEMLMMIIRWLTVTVVILLSSILIPGIKVDSLSTAVIAAALLGVINIFIRPILIILTLPLNILTLGFFTFILNALLLELVSYFVSGFKIGNFFSALLCALLISVVNWLTNNFIRNANKPDKPQNPDYIDLKKGKDDKWQ